MKALMGCAQFVTSMALLLAAGACGRGETTADRNTIKLDANFTTQSANTYSVSVTAELPVSIEAGTRFMFLVSRVVDGSSQYQSQVGMTKDRVSEVSAVIEGLDPFVYSIRASVDLNDNGRFDDAFYDLSGVYSNGQDKRVIIVDRDLVGLKIQVAPVQ